MMKAKNTPQIRFKGFSGEWVEKKLGEVADIVGGGTPGTTVPEYWNGNIDWYSPTEIGYSNYVNGSQKKITQLGLEKSSAKILPAYKTILFTSRAGIGDMGILIKDGATNQGFQSLVLEDEYIPYFIYSSGHLIKKYALTHASGSTFLEISGKQLGNMNIQIPNTNEQTQIGNYFQKLDKLIQQKELKHQKLKQFKKAMLSKMFPKDGESTPEIRFKGFSGEWVEKKLREVAKITTGFPFDSNDFSSDGEYLVITNSNIQNSSSFVDGSVGSRVNILNEKIIEQYALNRKDILITMDGTVGRVANVIEDKQILAQRVGRVIADINSNFVYYTLITGHFFKKMTLVSTGGTIKHISLNNIINYKINLPNSDEEQTQIGNYFQKLDKKIDLQAQEIKKLKNIKKAMLGKMFV
ncbi:restriction endonuclease subunit S [Francisellaceae bacterium CB300]